MDQEKKSSEPIVAREETVAEGEDVADNHFIVGEIIGPHVHGQSFLASQNGLEGIRLFVATFGRQTAGPLRFRVHQGEDSEAPIIFEHTIDASELRDNAWFAIVFPRQNASAGRWYHFQLDGPMGIPGRVPTVWASHHSAEHGALRWLNGLPVPGSLCFQPLYS